MSTQDRIAVDCDPVLTADGMIGISVKELIQVLSHDDADPDALVLIQPPTEDKDTEVTQFKYAGGSVVIDVDAHKVNIDGTDLFPPGRVFELLAFFARNPGKVHTPRDIGIHVWGNSSGSSATVRTHVVRARRVLGPHQAMLRTSTLPGGGYVFEDTVVEDPVDD